jgi:hypothetical protein
MKILTIGQDNFSIPNMDGYETDCYIPTDSLPDVIKYVQQSNADIIIIQSEQTAPESELYGGLELLIWLRIKGIKTHIVLVSFFSLEALMKNTKNAFILGAEGTTFCQMPFLTSFSELIELSKESAKEDNLKTYLSSIFDIVHFRHAYANVWGLKRLAEMHNLVSQNSDLDLSSNDINNSINYNIAEYIFKPQITYPLNVDDIKFLNNALTSIWDYNGRVIYLDDQANTGWFDLLKSILGKDLIKIDFEEHDNESTLFNKFEKIQNGRPIDLFICDLRLKDKEEDILDFKELISYKLIKKIRDKNAKQKLIYFSATNDLNKYKSLLAGARGNPDKYKPQFIFTKEGIDQNLTLEQSFNNYQNLINFFDLLFRVEKSIKKVQELSLFDLMKAEQIEQISLEIEKLNHPIENPASPFDKYDLIIFDTNSFYQPDVSIKILRYIHKYLEKSCVHLSVFAEMKNFSIVHRGKAEKEVQCLLASKCSDYFVSSKFNLSEECMTQQEIDKAKKLTLDKDFADKYLILLCKEKSSELKVLFVSGDKAKGTNKKRNEEDGPVPQLRKWIKEHQNGNLSICSPRNFFTFSPSNTSINLISNETLNLATPIQTQQSKKLKKERPKIKWKDCFLSNGCKEMIADFDGNQFVIKIGKSYQGGFKTVFEKLSQTEEQFEIQSDGFIYDIARWKNTANNL